MWVIHLSKVEISVKTYFKGSLNNHSFSVISERWLHMVYWALFLGILEPVFHAYV